MATPRLGQQLTARSFGSRASIRPGIQDLGGVGLGSFSPAAQDVFSEALPTPPIKVVRDFQLQEDVADVWIRRSRVPSLVNLDLRAKIGSNTVGRKRIEAVIAQYGADTVKAVMKRMMANAEDQLRTKLRSLPDGTFHATGYQDQSHEGDRSVHKITVAMTKADDHLTFDFTGTDPQAGMINCTYAGMRGGVMHALLPMLANDIGWSAGGLMRCFDLVAEEGTLNNASFPAAVGRGPIGPAWLTGSLVAECLSQLLDRSVDLGDNVQAACCGTWDTAVIAGLDERGSFPVPFLDVVMEPMAGGYGARRHKDGIDTGGLFAIPMGRVPDVEMTEFLYPLLTLWRREEPDSGGPGRQRGGVGASIALTLHGTETPAGLVFAAAGKAVAQNIGISGGYPGNTGLEMIVRGADVRSVLSAGSVPQTVDGFGGQAQIAQCYEQSYLAPGDTLVMHWQGGGGYGDPLRRSPEAIAADVIEFKVTADAAREVYGVVLNGGAVDVAATERLRAEKLARRREAGAAPASDAPRVDLAVAGRLDDNLVREGEKVGCAHCGHQLAEIGVDTELALLRYEGDSREAGPQILSAPGEYVDDEIVFRQLYCPDCLTAVYSGVVPRNHPDHVREVSRYASAH